MGATAPLRKPLAPEHRDAGDGLHCVALRLRTTPHPQPLSPEYRGEGRGRPRPVDPSPLVGDTAPVFPSLPRREGRPHAQAVAAAPAPLRRPRGSPRNGGRRAPHAARGASRPLRRHGTARHGRHQPSAGRPDRARRAQAGRQRRRCRHRRQRRPRPDGADVAAASAATCTPSSGTPRRRSSTASTPAAARPTPATRDFFADKGTRRRSPRPAR